MPKTIDPGRPLLARAGGLIALSALATVALAAPPVAPGAPESPATQTASAAATRAPIPATAAGAEALPAAAASGGDASAPSAPQGLGIGTPSATTLAGVPATRMVLETGLYRCELNRKVLIRTISPDRRNMVINWAGKDHTLDAVDALSGALRYEDVRAGLVWLVIVGKAMLLDSRKGQQLANECRL